MTIKKACRAFARRQYARFKIRRLSKTFEEGSYIENYAARTDAAVDIDPKLAIGGLWDDMGKHQLEFLVGQGLRPSSTILDIGCGTLRAGRFFIDYLSTHSYFGFDLSENAIKVGAEIVKSEGLTGKSPDLRQNVDRNLRFECYQGKNFDFLIAQSVFSHLKGPEIEECFKYIGSIMSNESAFFFTFHPGETQRRRGLIDFEYPDSFFEAISKQNSFKLIDLSEDYGHPRGQRMMKVIKCESK